MSLLSLCSNILNAINGFMWHLMSSALPVTREGTWHDVTCMTRDGSLKFWCQIRDTWFPHQKCPPTIGSFYWWVMGLYDIKIQHIKSHTVNLYVYSWYSRYEKYGKLELYPIILTYIPHKWITAGTWEPGHVHWSDNFSWSAQILWVGISRSINTRNLQTHTHINTAAMPSVDFNTF